MQATVIDRREWSSVELTSPEHLAQVLAPVFQRYAYPEVFFAARLPQETNFLARESRLPSWAGQGGQSAGIHWFKNAEVAKVLGTRVLSDAGSSRHYSVFPLNLGGAEYQVVIRFLRGADADSPMAIGFLVNMDWARMHYFIPTLESVVAGAGVPMESRVPDPTGVEFALFDQHGRAVGGGPEIPANRQPTKRRLNAYFFDPAMVSTEAVHDHEQWVWAIEVSAAADPTLAIGPALPVARCWCSRLARCSSRSGS